MSKQELMVDGLAPPISHYCDAVRFGDLLFISGVPPTDAKGALVGGDNVAAQTRQIFKNMKLVCVAQFVPRAYSGVQGKLARPRQRTAMKDYLFYIENSGQPDRYLDVLRKAGIPE